MRRLPLMLLLALAATGCRHRRPVAPVLVLPPAEPVPLDRAPATVAVVPAVPLAVAPQPAVKVPVRHKVKKKTTPAAVPAAPAQAAPVVQSASTGAAVPAASVVGALTAGGQNNSETEKQAAELLASIERRVKALPQSVLVAQADQVARVKFFWSQAHAALKAGDADGAMNLATKAKVMLDDVAR